MEIYCRDSYLGAVTVNADAAAGEIDVSWKCTTDASFGDKICFDRLQGTVTSVTNIELAK